MQHESRKHADFHIKVTPKYVIYGPPLHAACELLASHCYCWLILAFIVRSMLPSSPIHLSMTHALIGRPHLRLSALVQLKTSVFKAMAHVHCLNWRQCCANNEYLSVSLSMQERLIICTAAP